MAKKSMIIKASRKPKYKVRNTKFVNTLDVVFVVDPMLS